MEDAVDEFKVAEDLIVSLNEQLNIEHELECFREQWHAEIVTQRQRQSPPHHLHGVNEANALSRSDDNHNQCGETVDRYDEPSVEDQARYLFIQGVTAEQRGRFSNALQYYRRAVQLVPDIEFRIADFSKPYTADHHHQERVSESSSEADEVDCLDLLDHIRLVRIEDNDQYICQPNIQQKGTHISSLPREVLTYILKWIISSELDVHSLEQVSRVCRGFYLSARDDELWKLVCLRTWGKSCGRPTTFGSFRRMYIERPHLRFNGCYISKSTYYREGEKSLDSYYRPFHVVEYYRYIRFFPEGKVLLLTTPDNPFVALPSLRTRASSVQGLLIGLYKLTGDTVTLLLKRKQVNNEYLAPALRYGRRQKLAQNNSNDVEHIFKAELQVKTINGRPNWQLVWLQYNAQSIHRLTREENVVDFELNGGSYPPLMFSRVRSFTAVSDKPLN